MISKYIERTVQSRIEARLFQGRIIVVYGPRQVGKTTLIRQLLCKYPEDSLYLNCDEIDVREALTDTTSTRLKAWLGKIRLVAIDEAQRVKNIGITLKLLADTAPEMQVIATGSSSFELSNRIAEPLTGRKFTFHLFPFSLAELAKEETAQEQHRLLPERVTLGMYPEVALTGGIKAEEILGEIAGSYLYKDVLTWKEIRRPEVLDKLLRAIALQVGHQVSFTELGGLVGVDKHTVESYIDLLEKSFVIFRLPPFSRNLRNELKKLRKVYFYDLGIRNAVINNLNKPEVRHDMGALWENFMVSERLKYCANRGERKNAFFWRTHQQQEVDYIEEEGGTLMAAEFKWGKGKLSVPRIFREAYPGTDVCLVNPSNYTKFVGITP